MKLSDLEPELHGTVERGKIYFNCPHPGCDHLVCVMISSEPFHEEPSDFPGQRPVKYWQAIGDFPDTLTLRPSIDLVELDEKGNKIRTICWHGFITNGEVT